MKPKIFACLLSVVIFLAGIAGGVMLDQLVISRSKLQKAKRFMKFRGPERFARIQEHLQTKFTRELGLSAGQQAELKAIFDRRIPIMKAAVIEQDKQKEAIKEGTRQEIFKILNPAQKERFAEMIQKYKERRARRAPR